MLSTQVGGKYHPDDDSVFRVKQVLTRLGVAVSHPLADEIKAASPDHAFAFDPSVHSFSDVECHYYESIRTSDFHTVCNRFKENLGYLGCSASLEMAYAMCHGRPIVVLHPVSINTSVDSHMRSFIMPRLYHLIIHDFLRATSAQSRHVLSNLSAKRVSYRVSEEERYVVESRTRSLLDELER
ncbi:MAG: hypothetical protein ACRDRS_14330 [Pseudonocardiaceae bacterium]